MMCKYNFGFSDEELAEQADVTEDLENIAVAKNQQQEDANANSAEDEPEL